MSKRLILVLCLFSAVILLLMLNFTTPTGVGPLGILVFFAAFYILMFGVAMLLVALLTLISGKVVTKKSYLYGVVIAFGPIMLLLAQSLGTVNWMTLGLMIVFVFLGCFLVSKRA